MAPAVTATLPVEVPAYKLRPVSKDAFPDGIRTSGQHPPLYEKLKSYEEFPEQITGSTVWKKEDYVDNPERWVHRFSKEEATELGAAADAFMASGTPLTGITKDNFQLPKMAGFLSAIRAELLNGKGFILFKDFPVQEWGNHKSAVAYMGLGTYLGYFISQNGRGHVLGHVKDLGEDPTQIDKVRIYRTNARQFFHADDSDIVGLLCVARALEGGESDIVSSHNVYNILHRERPDVLKTLISPIWYFDRKGETSQGEEGYIRTSIFYLEPDGQGRVYSKYTPSPSPSSIPPSPPKPTNTTTNPPISRWDPYYIRSLTRFSSAGLIPPLSPAQLEAADVLESVCLREALHMVLEVGDIQFLSNEHVFHARTAYKDHAPPAPRRHLMRLWLATPEGEGGWRLPFHDSGERKRGGVQVDDVAPVAPLDAE
ncbi:hypothetical protein MMC10_003974 [Thelotrema lepadinum]|nr:hypothetical protein [Thelotrema lepadinum]